MDIFKIGYRLYYKGLVISTNVTEALKCVMSLTSESDGKCKTLRIAESPFDLFYVPVSLNKTGGKRCDISSYITRLDQILGGTISPDPLTDVEIPDLRTIEDTYNINIQVWEKIPVNEKNCQFDYKMIYSGSRYTQQLKFHAVCGWGQLLFIHDEDKYFNTLYQCPNSHYKCYYKATNKHNFDKHVKVCQDPAIMREDPICTQKEFNQKLHPINNLINLGVLDKEPVMTDHVFFDCESLTIPEPKRFGQTEILQTHKLLSIACNSYLDDKHDTVSWVVADDSDKAELSLVDKFITFLLKCEYRKKKSKDIVMAEDKLDDLISTEENKLASKGEEKSPHLSFLQKQQRTLAEYNVLTVMGYNSSKYDLKILIKLMMQCLERRKIITPGCRSGLSIMKKGTSYFSLRFRTIHFKDLMNFSTPMPLDKYLTTWTDKFTKELYPYEFFTDVLAIRNCTEFPAYVDFTSTLKGDCDRKLYNASKLKFDTHMSLPEGDKDRWTSFEDYLKFYNESDVRPASIAMLNQFSILREKFGVEPMVTYGIPSFSQYAMYGMFKETSPSVFTFPPNFGHLVKLFRSQTYGGVCSVYQRHCTTMDEDVAYAAKYNTSGQKWKTIKFYDVNSMYVSTYNKDMPTGRGIDWECDEKGCFTPKLITDNQYSFECCQWMDFMSNDARFINSLGERQAIQHAWNGDEVRIGPYPLDGYVEVDNMSYALQYDGCHVHSCDVCQVVFPKDDYERDTYISSKCVLIKIKSCEWKKILKSTELPTPKISPFLYNRKIAEDDIITAIKNNTITGFILCDIRPTPATEKFECICWPPIFTRQKIEFDEIPDWMKTQAKESSFPRETLIQTMRANQLLLHTKLVAFYLRNGFTISKIYRFVEYEASKCFEDGFQALYNLRVQATLNGNGPQASATKLTGNSFFGKNIQNPGKFTKHTICGEKILKQKSVKPSFQSSEKLSNSMYEVKEKILRIKEKYPIHIGNTILHLSKLLLAEFIVFLELYLIPDTWRLLYSGELHIITCRIS